MFPVQRPPLWSLGVEPQGAAVGVDPSCAAWAVFVSTSVTSRVPDWHSVAFYCRDFVLSMQATSPDHLFGVFLAVADFLVTSSRFVFA